MDERRGRATAVRFGLRPVGVLAILVEAKSRGLLPAVRPLIEALDERIAFRVHPDLLQSVLRRSGEA